jgi:hypothetical protein
MKSILASILIGVLVGISLVISMSACTTNYGTSAERVGTAGFTENEKHCLYSAALAASESPLESEIFKEVCKKIEIFDAHGNPNDNYMSFVKAHIDWAMKTENEPFKREINTKEKARAYLNKYLP